MIEFMGDDTWSVSDQYGEYAGEVYFEPHTGEYVASPQWGHQDIGGFDSVEDAADHVLGV